ncbi:MAG: hypothetical protein COA84_07760 [Robiginitomaculum sp.]|nr:MAG: hypothetical protein COA84_07760 [Robiginitomaculum sp.]
MTNTRADTLIEDYGKFTPMSMNEAGALAHRVFADGAASREEAEILLGACSLFDESDLGWRHVVSQEIQRHVLDDGQMRAGAEDWLIATLASLQTPQSISLDLVQGVMLAADNATAKLGQIGLRSALSCMKAVANDAQALSAQTG